MTERPIEAKSESGAVANLPEGRGVNFDRIFRFYYEKERRRSEDCIGSIINILTPSTETDSQKITQIIDTIIRHYNRA